METRSTYNDRERNRTKPKHNETISITMTLIRNYVILDTASETELDTFGLSSCKHIYRQTVSEILVFII